ncbi:MAG: histidine kinase [Actinomycetota bacterium]
MNRGLSDDARTASRIGMVVSNVWLAFLLFPLISVLANDLASWRKLVAVVVLVLFAMAHALGFRAMIRHEVGVLSSAQARRTGAAWFGVMILLTAVGLLVGGWPMFGVAPFLASSAVFQFERPRSWLMAGLTLAATIVIPLIGGVLGDFWFFPVIVGSVGAGAILIAYSEERTQERAAFETRLALSDERQRVARDVHDVLGHSLTAIVLKAQVVDRLLEQVEPEDVATRSTLAQAQEHLAELDSVSRRALAEIRSTVGGLRSADLADELTAARAVLLDAGVTLTIAGDAAGVDEPLRSVLGWVVREAVTNVVRHADAGRCSITLGDREGVLLQVHDDGIGMTDDEGNGLTGLRERVAAAGAELRIASSGSGQGTLVEVVA